MRSFCEPCRSRKVRARPVTGLQVSEHRIPIIYSRIIASAVGRRASELRAALPGTLSGSVDGYMSAAQYAELLRTARAVSGDPLIALKAGANIPFSVHGPVGIAAMSSETLGDALAVITRYATLRSPFCSVTATTQGDVAVYAFAMDTSLGDQSDAALDFIIATITHSIAGLITDPLRTFRVELKRRRPRTSRDYAAVLGGEVVYGAPRDAIVIDAAGLSTPLLGANPDELAKALERLRSMHLPQSRPTTLRESVLNTFASRSGHLCSLGEVARALGLSARTLQRRLDAEHTSFDALRDTWLSAQAVELLMRERLSVEVTATLLGYSEVANFRRSFRRWHGQPPADYRATQDRRRTRTTR